MKNTSLTQLFIGLIIGVLATVGIYSIKESNHNYAKNNSSSHMMPDGTMMNNVGMDMESQMQGMTMSLNGKTGEELEKAFVSEMIVHHQGAVEMSAKILESSYMGHPEITQLAAQIMDTQTKEIEMMKNWQKMWFK